MQRQSLGSPCSKQSCICGEDDGVKKLKARNGESYIHLIPMLTLLCFLILYLSSHDPSLNDLAQFNAFFNPASEGNISEFVDILTVRNLKQVPDAAKHRRLHRKFAHF